jgi:hypothetical protein
MWKWMEKRVEQEAFVYLWYDAPNKKYYLGKHKGYNEAGILLWDDKKGYLTEFPITIPQEILDYEAQFLKG